MASRDASVLHGLFLGSGASDENGGYYMHPRCGVDAVKLQLIRGRAELGFNLDKQSLFHVTAVGQQYRRERDQARTGMLLCKSKDQTVVEYALSDVHDQFCNAGGRKPEPATLLTQGVANPKFSAVCSLPKRQN